MENIKLGIFGGSGCYSIFDEKKDVEVQTHHGHTSSQISVGRIGGSYAVFMPRHGLKHVYPPHRVPYKANVSAFKDMGIERVVGPCAAGSLQPDVKPGDFVILDQMVDRTWGRDDTFFHGPEVAHVSFAEPYCPEMRKIAIEACERLNISHHPKGTVVVINGPRFSTKAESRWYSSLGWQVINMTQYPEAVLARELEMCYLGVALITDYDTGLEGRKDIKPVTMSEVSCIFKENNERVKKLIGEIIKTMPAVRSCKCGEAMKNAKV